MTYQDQWARGECITPGYRECATRYNVVKSVIKNVSRIMPSNVRTKRLTVLDIGANTCYFPIRIAEDFGACNITAFEPNPKAANAAEHLIKQNGMETRIELRREALSPEKLVAEFSRRHFDICLALSVFHHAKGSINDWLKAIQQVSFASIVEFAREDSTRPKAINYEHPKEARIVGYGRSHLDSSIDRPIWLFI